MRGVERPDPHERGHHRHAEGGGELGERASGVAVDHAAAGVDERTAGFSQHGEEERGRGRVEGRLAELVHAAAVAGNRQQALAPEDALPVLDVLGDIDDHRTRPARTGDLERGAHRGLEPGGVSDQENMLRDRSHNGGHRRLLERVGADGRGRDLAANYDNRHRISHAIAHRCNSVRRTGARGDQAHPHPARGAGVACRHETRPLLVGRDDERNLRLAQPYALLVVEKHGVVGGQDRPAAVAEYRGDALVGEHLHDHAGAAHSFAGQRMSLRAWLDHRVAHGSALGACAAGEASK